MKGTDRETLDNRLWGSPTPSANSGTKNKKGVYHSQSDQWADDQYKQRIEKWASITRRCDGDPKSFVYVIVDFVRFIELFVTQRIVHHIFLVLSQNLQEEFFLIRHRVAVACAVTNKRSLGWENGLDLSRTTCMFPIIIVVFRQHRTADLLG
jgi:hypothetical protein